MSEEPTVAGPGKRGRLELKPGVRIGSYTLTGREVGHGGYAHVYEATHPTLELRVAIKIQDAFGDPTIRARGLQEAMVIARIQHRNVVRVFDAGELDDGRQYLAMELLTGSTLREAMSHGVLPRPQASAFLQGIAGALDAVHARGLVHRDLKPSNIFLCRDDDGEVYPKLIDFGIAKDLSLPSDRELTTSGSFIGTPAYMSPEQCLGKRTIDARSDIYAFGVVAYQMLSGHPPFDGAVLEVAHAHAHAPVPSIASSELPAALDDAFQRILAKDPDARPSAATDAFELIENALAGLAPERPAPRAKTPRWVFLMGTLSLVALVASVWVTHGSSKPRPTTAPVVNATVVDSGVLVDAADSVSTPPVDAAVDAPLPVILDAAPKRVPKSTPPKSIDDVESLP